MRVRLPADRGLWVFLLAAVLLCGGCASFQKKSAEQEAAGPAKAPAPDERAEYRLLIDTPSSQLTRLLSEYLDLARFQHVKAKDAMTPAELDRLVAGTPAQARALLETEGYFNAQVTITRNESVPETTLARRATAGEDASSSVRMLDAHATEAAQAAPPIRVRVEPGPRAVVRQVDVAASGPLQAAADTGDTAARRTVRALSRDFALKPGQPFRQADWASAKTGALTNVRANGYASADWAETRAVVDAQANTVDITARVASGPLFRLGELRVQGVSRYDPQVVRNLAGFTPGTPYSEKLLLDFQDRLQKVGLFAGAVAEIDPNPEAAAATPVTVRVTELDEHQTTVGLGFSTNTGERATLEHLQRNVLGTNWQARNRFSLGRDLQSWQGQITSNPGPDWWRKLVAGKAERLISGDETTETLSARIGRTRESERLDRLYYLEALRSKVTSSVLSTGADALWGNYSWIFRRVDSVLLPTRGATLSLQTGAGIGRGDSTGTGPFMRAQSRLTWYKPLGNGWQGQARIEGGQVFAADRVGIPDTLLFRAGGDDSVRGYSYRALGPNVNGSIVSGKVMMTSSVEIAHPLLASMPTLWGALFVDAGNAAMDWAHLKPAVGYGAGLRLRSPVGPLRIDLAYGQQVKQFRLHVSVGVTF